MKPRIVYFQDNSEPCNYYRGGGVLSLLQRDGHIDLEEGYYGEFHFDKLARFHIAFFQRPMSYRCLQQVAEAKDCGLKVVVDLDDINEIPPSHPAYPLFLQEYRELEFKKIMKLADLVTVSTLPLKKWYSKYNDNIHVIPNSFNDFWLSILKPCDSKLVVIRGGGTHMQDMWSYRNQIIDVMKRHKEWSIITLGGKCNFLDVKGVSYSFEENTNFHNYLGWLARNKPEIIIVPLEDNDLNRCKSNISWIEATMCGAVSLTPSYWGMHNRSSGYTSKKTFMDNFERLINEKDRRLLLHRNSVNEINKNYNISEVNNKRLELLKALL